MANPNKFLDQLLLNSRTCPKIELHDKEMVSAQFENIRRFKLRQLRVFIVIFLVIFVFLSANILGEYFSIDTRTVSFGAFVFVPLFVLILFLIIFMFRYRCPHCGTVPAGTAISVGSDVTYARGINPFPQRCNCCGFYLSKRALRHDLNELRKSTAK
jgi:hypothetical protein